MKRQAASEGCRHKTDYRRKGFFQTLYLVTENFADFLAVRCLVSFPHGRYVIVGEATHAKISIFSETRSIVSLFFATTGEKSVIHGWSRILTLYIIHATKVWKKGKGHKNNPFHFYSICIPFQVEWRKTPMKWGISAT